MKKLVLLLGLATIFSCQKVYECECNYTHWIHGEKTEVLKIEAMSKGSAKDYCEQGAGIYTENPDCELNH